MPEYRVTFEIDTPEEINTPEEAARWTADYLAEGLTHRAVYGVTNRDTGETVDVDLEQL